MSVHVHCREGGGVWYDYVRAAYLVNVLPAVLYPLKLHVCTTIYVYMYMYMHSWLYNQVLCTCTLYVYYMSLVVVVV